uniref:Uncharacterized protein n=1 Tax=uncultured prokaryote TaxID=198431 RepID=A0A0H5Q4V3_9ZZZZ|nr:hypothetical protein [uncultured prokaryote]
MATNRVRVVTYLDPELAALLEETAKALGQSRSAMAAETLLAAVPVLEVLRDLGVTLQAAPDRHREALAALAVAIRPLADEAQAGLEVFEKLVTEPPPSNTGVRNG